ILQSLWRLRRPQWRLWDCAGKEPADGWKRNMQVMLPAVPGLLMRLITLQERILRKEQTMNCTKEDMLLYAVTDRAWTGEKTLMEQVKEALDGGITFLQLREKELGEEEFLREA